MTQSQHSQSSREALTEKIIDAKIRKNLTFEQINEGTGLSIVFVTAALLGQRPLPADAAKAVAEKLDLDEDGAICCRASRCGQYPGWSAHRSNHLPVLRNRADLRSTLKALVHEMLGDGIISAINFKLDIQKVDDRRADPAQ